MKDGDVGWNRTGPKQKDLKVDMKRGCGLS